MILPDPAKRPMLVVWAYRCWLISAVLLGLLGVGYILIGIFADGATLVPVGLGAFVLAIGVAVAMMGTKSYTGDVRWRSSLAALTLVATLMLVFISLVWNVMAFALLAAVVGLVGSLLAYRPESETWYTETPDTDKPRGDRANRKKTGRDKA
ncbi:hypothetical protein [Gordonia sp. NPDC003429]